MKNAELPRITISLLRDLLRASRNSLPDEFFALLSSTSKNHLIDEFILVPTYASDEDVLYSTNAFPIERGIAGTFHSHPVPDGRPSRTDRETFKITGNIHIIAFYPFSEHDWNAFDANGKKTHLTIEVDK